MGSNPICHPDMNFKDYKSFKDLDKVVAETELNVVSRGMTPYLDIAIYDSIFKKTYTEHYYAGFDKEGRFLLAVKPMYEDKIGWNTHLDMENVEEECRRRGYYIFRWFYQRAFVVLDDTILFFVTDWDTKENKQTGVLDGVLTRQSKDFVEEAFSFLKAGEADNRKTCGIALSGTYGISVRTNPIDDDYATDIEKNYNDDLPYDEIIERLNEKSQGLFLFYGKPGSGKTSLIKHLITVVDKPFIFADPTLFRTLSSTSLIEFLDCNKDAVLVLEDCERMVRSRDNGNDMSIGTLLNLTDGVIGDLMKVKFICTFNCPVEEIDEALTRKGRLKVKYEFKELSLEKTKAIIPEATEPMTLADIYNYTKKNDFSKKEKKAIGFGN